MCLKDFIAYMNKDPVTRTASMGSPYNQAGP